MRSLSDILDWLKANKEASETLKNLATLVGVAIGAVWSVVWTWHQLKKRRELYPHCTLDHEVTSLPLGEGKTLLRVTVRFHNIGKVLVRLPCGFTWVQQIEPLTDEIRDCVKQGVDPVQPGETETRWPLLGEREHNLGIEIEPDETDEFIAEFQIPSNVDQVLVYSHFTNPTKLAWFKRLRKKVGKGWHGSKVFPLPQQSDTQKSKLKK